MQWRGQAVGSLDVVLVLFMGCARLGGRMGNNEVRCARGEEEDGAVQDLVMSTHDQTNVQPTNSSSSSSNSSDDAGERLGKCRR